MTFFSSLTQSEQASFKAYRCGTSYNSNFSYDLNKKLRNSEKIPKRFESHLSNLDTITLKQNLNLSLYYIALVTVIPSNHC